MATVLNAVQDATSARQHWSEFIDGVVRDGKPAVVKRNRDFMATVSLDVMKQILQTYSLTLEHEMQEDGTVAGSLAEVDLVNEAQSVEELKEVMAGDLVTYAQEYMDNFSMYFHAPNRRAHLPYVLNVLLQADQSGVMELIHA